VFSLATFLGGEATSSTVCKTSLRWVSPYDSRVGLLLSREIHRSRSSLENGLLPPLHGRGNIIESHLGLNIVPSSPCHVVEVESTVRGARTIHRSWYMIRRALERTHTAARRHASNQPLRVPVGLLLHFDYRSACLRTAVGRASSLKVSISTMRTTATP
jgi:hypothetical protein